MNYINALPDFLAMQRVSFCWFITQGLNDELTLFSKIHDFSQNTEYIMFGEEYSLIKPPYSLSIARKYSGNYRAQLVIPIEVRNKILNSVRYQTQFPIITLPLMTTYATFIINGCERVIVSQIIRSPGIYFEKNKNQKNQKQFRKKLSTDINKLRKFLPSGEAFVSEFDLFFSVPKTTYDKIKRRKKIIPNWDSNSISYYSIKSLKETNQMSAVYFLECFKFYRSISKNLNILEHRLKYVMNNLAIEEMNNKHNVNIVDKKIVKIEKKETRSDKERLDQLLRNQGTWSINNDSEKFESVLLCVFMAKNKDSGQCYGDDQFEYNCLHCKNLPWFEYKF